MTTHSDNPISPDDLDRLLAHWHKANAARAAAGRDTLMARVREQARQETAPAAGRPGTPSPGEALAIFAGMIRRALVNRYSPVAGALVAAAVILAVLLPGPERGAVSAGVLYAPEGGRLDALDDEGNNLGPCALRHTDVRAEISGPFSRVTVRQSWHNEFPRKIEAVYTFPLSNRGAVDSMTMTVGDRVVIGEVHEREQARLMYEQARKDQYVAGLLEQERPNVFTQSIANIEPGAEVIIEIAYVEVLQSSEGTFTFDFPMVVGPRYVPGASTGSFAIIPEELDERAGLVLLGPAELSVGAAGDVTTLGTLQGGKLSRLIETARPIAYPGDRWWGAGDATGGAGEPRLWYRFEALYTDGSREFGDLHADGTGQLNGRWFYTDAAAIAGMGTGFAADTAQVPDASRVTPRPVKPGERSGHDISVTVAIDTGGPGIVSVNSPLHETLRREEGPAKMTVELARKSEIPNRDFVLSWKTAGASIEDSVFTHRDPRHGEGFFTLVLEPPARVVEADVQPRELVFVMDVSGSMDGFPIEKSKEVMTRAIDAMRPADTFNVVTFAGHTAVLWDEPMPATPENVITAKVFVDSQRGGGGTEMMAAIEAALVQKPRGSARLKESPDGRLELDVPFRDVLQTLVADPALQSYEVRLGPGGSTPLRLAPGVVLPTVFQPDGVTLRIRGRWADGNGRRVIVAESIAPAPPGRASAAPMRIAVFLTDGYVGNDYAIIDAVTRHFATTRVFSFGIGNSVNRFLIDGMARAGRGKAEVIVLASDADDAVARFTRRIRTPVLTDIQVAFSEGLAVTSTIPAPGAIPDLFDLEPLVINGRYGAPGRGTITIRGRTGAGPWERTIALDLPAEAPEHAAIASIWARAQVDEVLAPHLAAVQQGSPPADARAAVVALGEQFRIMTPYTSFIAIEKSRMTLDGVPVLVSVPVEMPEGVSYEGVFGRTVLTRTADTRENAMLGAELKGLQGRSYLSTTSSQALQRGRSEPPAMAPANPAPSERRRPPGPGPSGGMSNADEKSGSVEDGRFGGGSIGGGGGTAGAAGDSLHRKLSDGGVKGERGAGKRPVPAAAPRQRAQVVLEEVDQNAPSPAAGRESSIEAPQSQVSPGGDAADLVRRDRGLAGIEPGIVDDLSGADRAEAAADPPADQDAARPQRLRRILDPKLLALLMVESDKSTGPLRVTVLLASVDDTVLGALRAAGLSIEGSSRSLRIVVGKAAVADLEKLALLEGVRRIAPTDMRREN